MKDIIKSIIEAMGLTFYYATMEEANVLLDNASYPCGVMIPPFSGNVEIRANVIDDIPSIDVYFLKKPVNFRDSSETNADIYDTCLGYVKNFLDNLNDHVSIEIGSAITGTYNIVTENLFDANCIGYVITVTPRYADVRRCDS